MFFDRPAPGSKAMLVFIRNKTSDLATHEEVGSGAPLFRRMGAISKKALLTGMPAAKLVAASGTLAVSPQLSAR